MVSKTSGLEVLARALFADRAYYQGNDHAPNLDGDITNMSLTRLDPNGLSLCRRRQ